jgi:hypothetical protein
LISPKSPWNNLYNNLNNSQSSTHV